MTCAKPKGEVEGRNPAEPRARFLVPGGMDTFQGVFQQPVKACAGRGQAQHSVIGFFGNARIEMRA